MRPEAIVFGSPLAGAGGWRAVPKRGVPLRLWDAPFDGGDVVEQATEAALLSTDLRLERLHRRLAALCDPWRPATRLFLDGYFALIARLIADAAPALMADLGARAALYQPGDWRFAAWLPLPRAAWRGLARPLPFVFWGGEAPLAVVLAAAPPQGLPLPAVAVPPTALRADAPAAVAAALPETALAFRRGVAQPRAVAGYRSTSISSA